MKLQGNNNNVTSLSAKDLSPYLFWDSDIGQIDLQSSKKLIVQRVLEMGTLEDWKILVQMYGLDGIEGISLQLRYLDNVTLSFLCAIFEREKEDFRCYRLKRSNPNFWSY